jgi:hypothetical protein
MAKIVPEKSNSGTRYELRQHATPPCVDFIFETASGWGDMFYFGAKTSDF